MRTIALLTDFGNKDPYVGIMKGVISRYARASELGPGPASGQNLSFIDLTHEVPPFTIISGAYLLYSAWDWMPEGTVFLSVVDPGVGSRRRELIACADGKVLICPDNGSVSLLDRMKERVAYYRVKSEILEKLRSKKPPWSSTFDGRDLFSPVAGMLASYDTIEEALRETAEDGENFDKGMTFRKSEKTEGEKGPADRAGTVDPVLLPEAGYTGIKRIIKGYIIHRDRFGNCISSIHYLDVSELNAPECDALKRDGAKNAVARLDEVKSGVPPPSGLRIKNGFSDVGPGFPVVYWGSAGFLEVAVREGNAASRYGIGIGDTIALERPE